MSTPLTPSKRPYDRNLTEPNGKGKWQKSSGFYSQNQPLKVSPGSTLFRVLCPASKTGSVIGKGGTIISEIRQETGAKIRVEETVPGCDERVVVIVGSDKETECTPDESKEDGGGEADITEKGEDTKEQSENDGTKESVTDKDPNHEKGSSCVQKALLLVFERMVIGEIETDGGDDESGNSSSFVLRLLVLSSQVGCLLGKGGRVIKQMAAESKAQIRILPRDKLPPCVSASDELVQIIGSVDAVRKALQSISHQLLENPPREHDSFSANPSGSSSFAHSFSRPEVYPSPNHHFSAQGAPYNAGPRDIGDYNSAVLPLNPKFHESGISGRMRLSQDILTFRLLSPAERVGGIIGKGGTIVKTLEQETGCQIKVAEGFTDPEDSLILISGPAYPDDRISAAQEAVLRVQTRIFRAIPDNKEEKVARLLVSSNQIGCLLGKGGAIISEMRKLSGAYIRVGKDQMPKCASENDELVQINGEYEAVQEALLQITTRLRNHFFRDSFPSINHPFPFPDQAPPYPSYVGGREFSPPGMYPNFDSSFDNFDAIGGLPPHSGYHPHNDRSRFMHHRPGFSPHISERKQWGPQGLFEGGAPKGFTDFPQRRFAGHGGGSQPAIITRTTVEVVVPHSLIPVIYGEEGGCLKQIRQISDAKITITEPQSGAAETVIIISGTPEQTHAAQSLIQAFVMIETESS